ncbi:tautomerase family protein [Flavobacterium sp. TMP13]|uniref:tautomerase family protein n=1 Tax=unclassified Flavobacterium TaxID=196869 RepID=UPI0018D2254B|nr:tautomerase family protein [Flavobacterium sp. TAB 87]
MRRSIVAKKKLYQFLVECFQEELQINPIDLEITLIETPLHNWGIRGKSGDYLQLNYSISA